MPLISHKSNPPNGPLIPPGDALDPLTGIDPSGLIRGLQNQAKYKAKMWDDSSTYSRPDMPDVKKGLPADISFFEAQYYTALNSIEEGIRGAGGNAKHYLKTDEGLSNIRRASLSMADIQEAEIHRTAFDKEMERIQSAEGSGQEAFLDKSGNPLLDQSGRPMSTQEVLMQYITNKAYSPFWQKAAGIEGGPQRVYGQNLTTFEDARADIEKYFDQVGLNTYGTDDFQIVDLDAMGGAGTGLGKVMAFVRTQGYSNYENIKAILDGNGGLNNNLSHSMKAGLNRGFLESFNGDFDAMGYLDETGNLNEAYFEDREQWKYGEITKIAREALVTKHDVNKTVTGLPRSASSGSDEPQGYTKWDNIVNNRVSQEGSIDVSNRTYIAKNANGEISRHAPDLKLRTWNATDNPLQKEFGKVKKRHASMDEDGATKDYQVHLPELMYHEDYFYIKDGVGVTNVIDISGKDDDHGITAQDIIVQYVGSRVQEEIKPGIVRNKQGEGMRGLLTLREDGKINSTALSNWLPQDDDMKNTTTPTIEMSILIPAEKYQNIKIYDNDNPKGKFEKLSVGDGGGSWYADYERKDKPTAEGYGGSTSSQENWLEGSDNEIDITTHNGKDYVRITGFFPVNSSMTSVGMSEKAQKEANSRITQTSEDARDREIMKLQQAADQLDALYEKE